MRMVGESFFRWVEEHREEDPTRLRLRFLSGNNRTETDFVEMAIGHIEALQRGGKKLEGLRDFGLAPDIIYPPFALEQCSSAETALLHVKIAEKYITRDAKQLLDLTFGLGIDAIAFAKAGFTVTGLEIIEEQAKVANYNYRKTDNIRILNDDCERFLKYSDEHFDFIFIDPARRDSTGRRVYGIGDCRPNVSELTGLIEKRGDILLAKLSPMLDIKQTLREMPRTSELHVIGSNGECKELFTISDFRDDDVAETDSISISVDINGQEGILVFNLREESEARKRTEYSEPIQGRVLYVPDAAIMKAGCFGTLAERYNMAMISKDSHLFVSENEIMKFPGKGYRILWTTAWSKRAAKNLKEIYTEASVTARNFPMSSDELRKRTGLKESDSYQLFATTDRDGKKILIMTEGI